MHAEPRAIAAAHQVAPAPTLLLLRNGRAGVWRRAGRLNLAAFSLGWLARTVHRLWRRHDR